jgi:DNA (cytosine-5)-methyltransferase 1
MNEKLRVLDLFSGIGGFSLGLERTGGFETVAFCEIDPYCRAVLRKHWPEHTIFTDVRKLWVAGGTLLQSSGGAQIRGGIDVVCGGFPCQDISVSGRRAGIDGARSGLWTEFARLIRDLRPRYAIVENTPGLLSLGMDRVIGDLAGLGYDAEWRVIRASDVGLPTLRRRLWIVAFPVRSGRQGCFQHVGSFGLSSSSSAIGRDQAVRARAALEHHFSSLRSDYGFPVAVERRRIGSLGNAVVPQIPEIIGQAILETEGMKP